MHADGRHAGLLSLLDFDSAAGRDLLASIERQFGTATARARRHFDRIFTLRSPFAANSHFVGAQATVAGWPDGKPVRVNAGGTGMSRDRAVASCIGEGVEYLAQVERPDDIRLSAPLADLGDRVTSEIARWIEQHGSDGAPDTLDWVEGVLPLSGRTALLPADLCLRRQDGRLGITPRGALSTGCAAGTSFEAAALHALLELIERDAAALWWLGGRCGRPVAADAPAALEAARLLPLLRGGADGRSSWLLDISTEFDIPVIAALSANDAGFEVACGIAARLDAGVAAQAATLEMMQVELALTVIAAKRREAGDAALSDSDRRHLRRATQLDASKCQLLHGIGMPRRMDAQRIAAAPHAVLERLAAQGVAACWLDLSRADIELPVVRAVAPALQALPSTLVTARLAAAIDAHGGGAQHTHGIELL
ncbi:YcaO-like family protein [Reyranella sp. CPCC 100927]|uniref:YcaO-like family protein n=1 Tax=Reyranella sp. CPCC 100927 TaxID=2599616 RepID=UPI0011B83C8B|nr:YcaO-like family protein [Reyranella sp. CPCC 100927]TWS97108.1 hypothetical protein FQU96_38230 [Reyranella sp. CPCC 100927]